ncbi:MAG: hypothetical protein ABR600_04855 [Actinomycetota bacterium]
MHDGEIRDLLRERSGDVRLDPAVPKRVRQRARRRRVGNVVLSTALVAGVAVGAFAGVQAVQQGHVLPPPPIPATALPTPSGGWFEGIWPEDNADDLAAEQARIDEGQEAWRLATNEVAMRFAEQVLLWTPGDIETVSSDKASREPSVVNVYNTGLRTDGGENAYVEVAMAQLGQTGDGGAWSVTTIRGTLDERCPNETTLTIGQPVEVCGSLSYAPDGSYVNAYLRAGQHGREDLFEDMGSRPVASFPVTHGGFDEEVGRVSSVYGDTAILVVRALDPSGVTIAFFARKYPVKPANDAEPAVWQPNSEAASSDPKAAALAFATEVLNWQRDRVHVEATQDGDRLYEDLWNEDMTSQFTEVTRTRLTMEDLSGQFAVLRVESGLFDVECPSMRQDVILTPAPVDICGTFAQSPTDWIVKATVEYAASNLSSSEAQSTADIPVHGKQFSGPLKLIATYAGDDVSVQVRVYSASGETLGLYARRFQTEVSDGRSP